MCECRESILHASVSTLGGRQFSCQISPQSTVAELKEKFAESFQDALLKEKVAEVKEMIDHMTKLRNVGQSVAVLKAAELKLAQAVEDVEDLKKKKPVAAFERLVLGNQECEDDAESVAELGVGSCSTLEFTLIHRAAWQVEWLEKVMSPNFNTRLPWLPEFVQSDSAIVAAWIGRFGIGPYHSGPIFFQDVLPDLRSHPQVVLSAVRGNGLALKHAGLEFQADRKIVKTAVMQNEFALKYASRELRADFDIVQAAANGDLSVLRYAAAELRDRKDLMLPIVSQDGLAARYAGPRLHADREFMLRAVRNNCGALVFAAPEIELSLRLAASKQWYSRYRQRPKVHHIVPCKFCWLCAQHIAYKCCACGRTWEMPPFYQAGNLFYQAGNCWRGGINPIRERRRRHQSTIPDVDNELIQVGARVRLRCGRYPGVITRVYHDYSVQIYWLRVRKKERKKGKGYPNRGYMCRRDFRTNVVFIDSKKDHENRIPANSSQFHNEMGVLDEQDSQCSRHEHAESGEPEQPKQKVCWHQLQLIIANAPSKSRQRKCSDNRRIQYLARLCGGDTVTSRAWSYRLSRQATLCETQHQNGDILKRAEQKSHQWALIDRRQRKAETRHRKKSGKKKFAFAKWIESEIDIDEEQN